MKEQLKKLRKSLELTQQAFADKIGMKQNTIAQYEMGRTVPSDAIVFSICREFNINEDWLRNGTGEMFVTSDTFCLDDFVKQKGATDFELEIVKTYFELDPDIRKAVMEHFKSKLSTAVSANPALAVPDTAEDLEKLYPPVELDTDDSSNVG